MTRIWVSTRSSMIIVFLLISIYSISYFFSFKYNLLGTEEQFSQTDINYNHKINNSDNGENDSDVEIYSQEEYPFTIVTAASSNHYCAVQSWLYYMRETLNSIPMSERPRVMIYDIGLANYQKRWIRVFLEKKYMTELRDFEFERYPEFWRIEGGTRGEYGWKPGIISEVIRDYPGPTVWLDSGTYPTPSFLKQFNTILNYYDGFFSPVSTGYIPKWTHKGVFDYFNDDAIKYSNYTNCNGAVIAFDSNKKKINSLLKNWLKCARIKTCIAPEGSNRTNHRQDQAILTYLAAKENRFCMNRVEFFGLKTHMDNVCEKNIYFYESLNNITWNPNIEDMNEMEVVKESVHHLYDIWNPGSKEKMLDRIREDDKEIFDYVFNLDQD